MAEIPYVKFDSWMDTVTELPGKRAWAPDFSREEVREDVRRAIAGTYGPKRVSIVTNVGAGAKMETRVDDLRRLYGADILQGVTHLVFDSVSPVIEEDDAVLVHRWQAKGRRGEPVRCVQWETTGTIRRIVTLTAQV